MRYATKKECSSLLAMLGEESLLACKRRNEPEASVGVSWVGDHIVTVENFEGQLIVRVTAVLPMMYGEEVECRMHVAAMREAGYYHLSSRSLSGFILAEVTVYGIPNTTHPAFRQEVETMCGKLDAICHHDVG